MGREGYSEQQAQLIQGLSCIKVLSALYKRYSGAIRWEEGEWGSQGWSVSSEGCTPQRPGFEVFQMIPQLGHRGLVGTTWCPSPPQGVQDIRTRRCLFQKEIPVLS